MKRKYLLGAALFAVLLTLTLLLVLPASATTVSGVCGSNGDNVVWSFEPSSGHLSITGAGEMKSYANSALIPWYSHHQSIKSITVGEGVTSIGSWAFADCESLTSASLPSTLTELGNCVFLDCDSIKSISLPNKLKYIGYDAFANCRSLTSFAIPDSVTFIDSAILSGCSSLTHVTVGSGIKSIEKKTFQNCISLIGVEIPDSVKHIRDSAFYGCDSLTEITLPTSLVSIGSKAFYFCFSLKEITLPATLTDVGTGTFDGCYALKTVNYNGTQEEWDAIAFGVQNEKLTEARARTVEQQNAANQAPTPSDEDENPPRMGGRIILFAVAGALTLAVLSVVLTLVVRKKKQALG